MLKIIRPFAARIIIGIAFFVFGFFVVAQAMGLSLSDIVVGMTAGAVGGLTMLVVTLGNSVPLPPKLKARLFGA